MRLNGDNGEIWPTGNPDMTIKVKICGLSSEADVDVAVEHGADFVGFVFFGPSPRNLDISRGKQLAEHVRGRAKIVALTVNADDMLIKRITREVGPDVFQLHGSEDEARIGEISALTGCETMKVIKVETQVDAGHAFDFKDTVDHILFDAKAPKDAPVPGGNGLTFDWRTLDGISAKLNYMLSGGLTSENVAEAVRLTGAAAVDVSSGVETRPGEKDPARIRAFLQAAKGL